MDDNLYFYIFNTTKISYYLWIFTHRSKFVGKFSITYEYYIRTTLPTNITHIFESIGKFSITYEYYLRTTLLTNITHKFEFVGKFSITYQLLPTNLYYLPTTNYYPRISIIYQLLLKNFYYLPTITNKCLLLTNYYHNNYIHNIKKFIIIWIITKS